MRTCTLQPQIDRERSGHERSELPRERKSRHALRAVPLRGECYRTHRSAPAPAGRSSAGGMEGRKCYPCLCLKCYPCPCPPPSPTLSPFVPHGEREKTGFSLLQCLIQWQWGRGEEGLRFPLSSFLSPLLRRGARRKKRESWRQIDEH